MHWGWTISNMEVYGVSVYWSGCMEKNLINVGVGGVRQSQIWGWGSAFFLICPPNPPCFIDLTHISSLSLLQNRHSIKNMFCACHWTFVIACFILKILITSNVNYTKWWMQFVLGIVYSIYKYRNVCRTNWYLDRKRSYSELQLWILNELLHIIWYRHSVWHLYWTHWEKYIWIFYVSCINDIYMKKPCLSLISGTWFEIVLL